jgi:ATP-dependent Clp protease ATP-binding subunit ClpC
MTLAAEESRRLGHEYVGTEHILLALTLEASFAKSGVPARLGVNADAVRARVLDLVHRGPLEQQQASDRPAELPLTPRATRAIQTASDEAASVSLPLAGPEHLLIGLIRDPYGVAGRVLRDMGLDEGRVRAECLLVRLRQMQIVERAVRPVRASAKRKRRMREELLTHLSAICEQEQQAASIDVLAALDAAARRFGNPAELARELQASVPRSERIDAWIEYWLGWRAPESVLRMLLRTSLLSFCLLAAFGVIALLASFLVSRDNASDGVRLRVFLSLMLLPPMAQFSVGWCYYKARDSLWGAFGAKRSPARAAAWMLATAVVVLMCGLGFVFGVEGSVARIVDSMPSICAGAIGAAMTCGLLARFRGLVEIRDAMWGLLPINTAA